MSIKDEAINWVKDYFEKNGNPQTKAVIGVSGGKDSSTVEALCCAALGKDRVIGVMMPNGVQADIEDSKKLCAFLGIKNYTVNIADAYNGLTRAIKDSVGTVVYLLKEVFNDRYEKTFKTFSGPRGHSIQHHCFSPACRITLS